MTRVIIDTRPCRNWKAAPMAKQLKRLKDHEQRSETKSKQKQKPADCADVARPRADPAA